MSFVLPSLAAAALSIVAYWRCRRRLAAFLAWRARLHDAILETRHNLRTPATAVKGFTLMLKTRWDELTPEKRRHYLDMIVSESDKLNAAVDEFMKREENGLARRPDSP